MLSRMCGRYSLVCTRMHALRLRIFEVICKRQYVHVQLGSEGSGTQASMASGAFKNDTSTGRKKGLLTYAGIMRLG